MGRLFWKVFLGFWLTMLAVAGIAALAVMVAQQQASEDLEAPAGTDEPANRVNGVVTGRWAAGLVLHQAMVLRHGGEAALRDMLATPVLEGRRAQRRGLTRDAVRVVDDSGTDLLARPVAADALALARRYLRNGRPGLMQVQTPVGRNYLLFVPRTAQMRTGRLRRPWWWDISPTLVASGGVLFSMLFSALLAGYLSRPIRTLRQGFDSVADGNLDTRVGQRMGRRSDELADLGEHFDNTINRLQQLIQSQQRLLHDVSHELRSPLARIQAAIGLTQQKPGRSDEMMQRIERESVRLDLLVGEILALSRMDDAQSVATNELVDLDDLIADIAADARLEGTSRQINVTVTGTGGHLAADAGLLHRALDNLVRNAVKYTADNTSVSIDIHRSNAQVTIGIQDQGPGIEQQELDAMTEPFVRGKAGINQPDGFGLGLAIAQRAINLHQGKLSLQSGNHGGLLATVTLPIRNATFPAASDAVGERPDQ